MLNPNDIIVGEHRRPLNPERVAELERSIAAIGLQTPITIRYATGYLDDKPTLVAGAHRLQAVKNLGWSEIPAHVFEGDDREARMWELAENLHRAELTALERSEQLAEWIRLAEECDAAQVDPHQPRKAGQQPGGVNQASRDLGIDRKAAQRAAKIDSLAPEAKAAAVELGLDDNQSALLEAAKAETADEQVDALRQRKERKSATKASDQPGGQVSPIEPASETFLSEEEQDAFKREHPTMMKSLKDINRALKRCSSEERQFLCKYELPGTLEWFGLGTVTTALFDEIPLGADLDQLAELFADLTISQQADVIERADRMREAAQAQTVEPTRRSRPDHPHSPPPNPGLTSEPR
jgi:ParB-like chromosome segregation protein Spo0J